jgi:DNA-binding NarL/FixJ family response regulator
MNTGHPSSSILTMNTCARCGREFSVSGREYTCKACKEKGPSPDKTASKLSSREKQIVGLIQEAKSNKEIAYELSLTVGTVKEYLYHVFRKLGVANRTELALRGRDYLSEMGS